MSDMLRFCLAQINPTVGDLKGNCQLIMDTVRSAEHQSAHMLVFPELALTGYMPEDMLLREGFMHSVESAREHVRKSTKDTPLWIAVGYPGIDEGALKNTLGILHRGEWVCEYHKRCLPNETVFDERRYFEAGSTPVVCDIEGMAVGLSVCEDMWHPKPVEELAGQGACMLVNISASPFSRTKHAERLKQACARTREVSLPMLYVNLVGAQDELVFDGGSFVLDHTGETVMQAPHFESGTYLVDVHNKKPHIGLTSQHKAIQPDPIEMVYKALSLGLGDYVHKNGFEHVLLGLSGGVDSALCLAIAVDVLGADAVTAVMMPSRYTSDMSVRLAKTQTENMGVNCLNIGIDKLCKAFEHALKPGFQGLAEDTTEENLQARCRGTLLMALSNKLGGLLLSTGNKSEMAVGYATLYGDMAGGFNPIKDVPKTLVYELVRWRNRGIEVIPPEVISRPASAELRDNQKDSDMLPPYKVLDEILERYVEGGQSAEEIIASGMDADTTHGIIKRLHLNEYKRQQSTIGTRISECSFSRRDRRYPVSAKWTEVQ
jgi:NAD+ synthase (glutamine-hydrolysing)